MENFVSQVTALQPEIRKRGRPKGSKNKPKRKREKTVKLLPIFSSQEPVKQPEILPPVGAESSGNPESAGSSLPDAAPDAFDRAAAQVISENGAGGCAASEQSKPQGEVLPPPDYFRKKAAALIPKPFRMMAIALDAPTLELEDKIVELLADDGALALEEAWPILKNLFGETKYKNCLVFGAMFTLLTGDKLLDAWKLFREKNKTDNPPKDFAKT